MKVGIHLMHCGVYLVGLLATIAYCAGVWEGPEFGKELDKEKWVISDSMLATFGDPVDENKVRGRSANDAAPLERERERVEHDRPTVSPQCARILSHQLPSLSCPPHVLPAPPRPSSFPLPLPISLCPSLPLPSPFPLSLLPSTSVRARRELSINILVLILLTLLIHSIAVIILVLLSLSVLNPLAPGPPHRTFLMLLALVVNSFLLSLVSSNPFILIGQVSCSCLLLLRPSPSHAPPCEFSVYHPRGVSFGGGGSSLGGAAAQGQESLVMKRPGTRVQGALDPIATSETAVTDVVVDDTGGGSIGGREVPRAVQVDMSVGDASGQQLALREILGGRGRRDAHSSMALRRSGPSRFPCSFMSCQAGAGHVAGTRAAFGASSRGSR